MPFSKNQKAEALSSTHGPVRIHRPRENASPASKGNDGHPAKESEKDGSLR
jgi:hypothetical protein